MMRISAFERLVLWRYSVSSLVMDANGDVFDVTGRTGMNVIAVGEGGVNRFVRSKVWQNTCGETCWFEDLLEDGGPRSTAGAAMIISAQCFIASRGGKCTSQF
jgi:hypothetical protein